MIAVIADDLTGAAEIGGIGMRYGLTVEINTVADLKSKADLLIIATDTRSMPEKQAISEMAEISALLYEIKPNLIFKKVDSVLRGHIIAELLIHLEKLHLKRALLVPANPALGRTLTNGKYFINGLPVHLSSFANDPEFAINSSNVYDMLRIDQNEAFICTKDSELPHSGIIVGECAVDEDLNAWINHADEDTILAGGSGFFNAMLKASVPKRKIKLRKNTTEFKNPALFVCGSTFDKSKQLVEEVYNCGGPVSYMPLEIILSADPSDALFEKWADEVVSLLEKNNKAIVAIHEDTTKGKDVSAGSLRKKKAIVIEKIFQKITMHELFVEGGSTAAAIIKQLNFSRFYPVEEFSAGVIRMKTGATNNLFLTLKPGSYEWASHIWDF